MLWYYQLDHKPTILFQNKIFNKNTTSKLNSVNTLLNDENLFL